MTMVLLSSETPLKQSQVIIILKKKKKIQGQEYDTAYVKGENQFPAYTTCHGLRSSQRTK